MSWIIVAIGAYFLGALAVLMDKFLLGSKRVSSPQVYTFYIGVFGLGAFLFAPFGFSIPSSMQLSISLISGVFYMAGMFALNVSINKAEASRVTPVVFSVLPLATYAISYLFNNEKLSALQLGGVVILIFGGLLISFDLPLKLNKKKFFKGFHMACLSGLLLAISHVMFKMLNDEQSFFSGFIWMRIGGFAGVLLFFLVPTWRKAIFKSFTHAKNPSRKHVHTGGLFILNKVMGGTSAILIYVAIGLGSVTLVNSMISLQYVFVLLLVAIAARKHPEVFAEKLFFWDWAQKVAAIFIIALGVLFVSM